MESRDFCGGNDFREENVVYGVAVEWEEGKPLVVRSRLVSRASSQDY